MLYIHIPFCKQRCIYCDFYSTVLNSNKLTAYIDALCAEIQQRAALSTKPLTSIYIGGGTPSIIPIQGLRKIFQTILQHFTISETAEITMELNPDDVTPQYVADLKQLGINRTSLGIQTFADKHLRFLNRRHDANKAIVAVQTIHEVGIDNISIDLIFGLPEQTIDEWQQDLEKALTLPISHLSAYSLMYEPNTLLTKKLEQGEIKEVSEELSLKMFKTLCQTLKNHGFEHYEISNFCRPGYASRHNSGYWCGKPYIGVGAGAHSFDGENRAYNIENLEAYIQSHGCPPHESETLNNNERINEFIFTRLRTASGINLMELEARFGHETKQLILSLAKQHISNQLLTFENNVVKLSEEGIFVSDDVMSDLMLID